MQRVNRWMVAGLVTAAVFGLITWVAGGFLLPLVMASEANRWVIAAGAGVALAAVSAIGIVPWAARGGNTQPEGVAQSVPPSTSIVSPTEDKSINAGGDISGIASTGDNTINIQQR